MLLSLYPFPVKIIFSIIIDGLNEKLNSPPALLLAKRIPLPPVPKTFVPVTFEIVKDDCIYDKKPLTEGRNILMILAPKNTKK